MQAENVLYTDGHDVIVTDSIFQVKRKWYSLSGITKHGLSIVRPAGFPSLLLLSGAILEVIGATSLIPDRWVSNLTVFTIALTTHQLIVSIGMILLVLGSVVMWFAKERYAVRITTAEGEKDVVVSESKEYINQILHALNEAIFNRIKTDPGSRREFIVSGR